jgi:hypothetical protein
MKLRIIVSALAVVGAALAFGCSSAPTDGSEASSNEALSLGKGAKCIFGSGIKCGPGLTCVGNGGVDTGVCEPTLCGPNSPGHATCSAGFYCDVAVDVGHCLPNGSCDDAEDCKGLLPQLCMRCSDGSSGCAHHACVAGKCEIAYCSK